MASSLSAITNHNLHLAKLLLVQLNQQLLSEPSKEALLLDAFGQAVVWHLQRSVHALVAELADRARLAPELAMQRVFENQHGDIDSLPAELREVAVLQRDAWLGQLMTAERVETYSKPSHKSDVSLVVVHSVADNYFGIEELRSWFSHFDALLDRFRETTVEW